MDRRTFLKTSTVTAATTVGAAGSAAAFAGTSLADDPAPEIAAPFIVPARYEWRLEYAATPAAQDEVRELAAEIFEASGGRIVLEPEAAAAGASEASYGLLPERLGDEHLALFSGLPGPRALAAADLLAWQSAAGGDLLANEAVAPYGVVALIAGHSGESPGFWASGEIQDLRSFAAAEVTTSGLGRRVVEEIQSPFASRGTAAGPVLFEAPAGVLETQMSLPEAERRIWYGDGLHRSGMANHLLIGARAWVELTPSDQLLVRSVAERAAYRALSRARVASVMVVRQLAKAGIIHRAVLPEDVVNAFEHVAATVIETSIVAEPGHARAWTAYQAFYEAIAGQPLPFGRSGARV